MRNLPPLGSKMDIEFIRGQLQRRLHERQLSKVERGSGISRRTMYRIIEGGANPKMHTLDALEAFLRRTMREKKLEKGE